jgi:hypothetical protein
MAVIVNYLKSLVPLERYIIAPDVNPGFDLIKKLKVP